MAPITHAISIRQPLVEHILRGIKTREYRSQATRIKGRVHLYAALKPRTERREWAKVGKASGELPAGAIVGSVEIVSCRRDPKGVYVYLLQRPRRYRKPYYVRNQPQPRFWIPQFRGARPPA